ncbi:unnamed protein product, partial [Fusarium langsethiae]
MRPSTTLRLLG